MSETFSTGSLFSGFVCFPRGKNLKSFFMIIL
jgi:hypothetical protein